MGCGCNKNIQRNVRVGNKPTIKLVLTSQSLPPVSPPPLTPTQLKALSSPDVSSQTTGMNRERLAIERKKRLEVLRRTLGKA